MRFVNWKYPEIQERKLTEYYWLVHHRDNLKLGTHTDIGAFTYLNAKAGITIEDFVQIGSHCSLYSISTIDGNEGPIHLQKNCRIGTHSVIMPNVIVGKNTIIGACSYVNRTIPDNVMAFGTPARVVRKLTEEEIRAREAETQ
jgi:acetyltransferase-like isoleucine patch superfamily enzyme